MNYSTKLVLYKGNHELQTNNGTGISRVVTVYKPQESQMKELVVDLTDDNNPFILHSLKLSEPDYQIIKATQGLTSEFSSFPDKLISLLKQTLLENTKMYVSIEEEKPWVVVSVKEEGVVKHVTQLSLKFQHGGESDIRQRVLDYIASLQRVVYTTENRCKELTALSSSLQERLQKKDSEIVDLEEQLKQQKYELESKMMAETSAVTKSKEKMIRGLQREYDDKLQNYESAKREEIEQLNTAIKSLEREKSTMKRDIEVLTKKLHENQLQLESTSKELKQTEKYLSSERVDLQKTKEELNLKQTKLDELNSQLEKMKNFVGVKHRTEEELRDELTSALNDNEKLKEKYSSCKKNLHSARLELTSLQEQYNSKCSDVDKANHIIKNLQNELTTLQSHKAQMKMKLETLLINQSCYDKERKKLEKTLRETEKKLAEYEIERESKSDEIKKLQIEKLGLQTHVSDLYRELREMKQGTKNTRLSPLEKNDGGVGSFYFKKILQESAIQDNPGLPSLQKPSEINSKDGNEDKSVPQMHQNKQELFKPLSNLPTDKDIRDQPRKSPQSSASKPIDNPASKNGPARSNWIGIKNKNVGNNRQEKKT